MRIALTGISGFLGRSFVAAALAAGHRVRGLAPAPAGPPIPGADVITADLGDDQALRSLLAGQDVLVHLAALGVQRRDREWGRMTAVNVVQPLGLLERVAESGIARVVLAGTCLEYAGHGRLPAARARGDERCAEASSIEGTDGYGATKAAGGLVARARARELGLAAWYLRFASLYGPGDDARKLLPAAIAAALSRAPFETTGGEQEREWLHVRDAARALLAACDRAPPEPATIVNVGTGEGVRLRDVVAKVFRLARADPALIRLGVRPYSGEPHRLVMDVGRARALLSWRPLEELDDALEALVAAAERERTANG